MEQVYIEKPEKVKMRFLEESDLVQYSSNTDSEGIRPDIHKVLVFNTGMTRLKGN